MSKSIGLESGETIEISDEAYRQFALWHRVQEQIMRGFGQELAARMPKTFYGSVQFNIKAGNYVNFNVVQSGK